VRHGAGLEAKAFASVYRATSVRSSYTICLSGLPRLAPPFCVSRVSYLHPAFPLSLSPAPKSFPSFVIPMFSLPAVQAQVRDRLRVIR
jgi:hypothetical protein